MISVHQIRAARALLNIKQSELALMAGISLASLNNIEREVTVPRTNTLSKIRKALESFGIEFTSQEGVRRRQEQHSVQIFEGYSAIKIWFSDIVEVLKRTEAGTVFLLGIDDKKFSQNHQEDFDHYLMMLAKNKWREKALICEGDRHLYAPQKTTEYRWVSKEIFTQVPYAVYGDTYAIITWGPPIRLTLIRNQSIADSMRRQFMNHWQAAQHVY